MNPILASKAKEIAESVIKYFLENWGTESQKEVETFAVNTWLATPQAAALLSGEDWISVGTGKPDIGRVSFKDKHGNIFNGNYSKSSERFYAYGFSKEIENVTHWKPLPKAPENG